MLNEEDYCIEIEYPNGLKILVDESDAKWVQQWNWRLDKTGYVVRGVREYGYYVIKRLHRELCIKNGLLKPDDVWIVKHRNGDKLDNRMSNLEVIPVKKACHNMPKRWVDGVCKDDDMWRAYLEVNNRLVFLGKFPTKRMAQSMYNQMKERVKHIGDYEGL